MKRTMFPILLASCTSSYQGSFEDLEIGPMRHSIDVKVNGWTSAGTALQYAHRRATELCPDGYDTVDETKGDRKSYVANGNNVTEVNKPEVALIVQCREQEATRPPPVAVMKQPNEDRRIVYGDTPLSCTTNGKGTLCFVDEATCNRFIERHGSNVPCFARTSAACYVERLVVDGGRATVCAPTIRECESMLGGQRSSPDVADLPDDCAIYRVRGSE